MGIVVWMQCTSFPGQSHLQMDAGAGSWGWGAFFPLGKEYRAGTRAWPLGSGFCLNLGLDMTLVCGRFSSHSSRQWGNDI